MAEIYCESSHDVKWLNLEPHLSVSEKPDGRVLLYPIKILEITLYWIRLNQNITKPKKNKQGREIC